MIAASVLALGRPTTSLAQAVDPAGRPIAQVATTLKAGEYVWAPGDTPDGPGLLIVNLATQHAVLFRNGVPIAASSVSTGKPGYDTPTGVFTVLEKRKEHYSKTYNNASMPNMQRLTWKGVALHAGNLPGYPASHGCIRLPAKFSALLFDTTTLGMTVIITSLPAAPERSDAPDLAAAIPPAAKTLARAPFEWHPERSASGPVSVIISIADQHAIVLRNGVEIGSAPVRVSGDATGAWAYALRSWNQSGQQWLKLQFSGSGAGMQVSPGEGDRFDAPWDFRHAVATVLRPGSIIIVTPQSLRSGSSGSSATVIENEEDKP